MAQDYPQVRVILATELTVATSIGSVDLLCYGFRSPFPPAIEDLLATYRTVALEYGRVRADAVRAAGIAFSEEEHRAVLQSYRPERVNVVQGLAPMQLPHLLHFLGERDGMDRDEVAGLREKIDTTVQPRYPSAADVVPAVKEAGARVAIAHPHRYFDGNDAERMDRLRVECDLDGIECAHPTVPSEYTELYRQYCEAYDLFSVGGSDCHKESDVQERFTGHVGEDAWLDEFLNRLDEASR